MTSGWIILARSKPDSQRMLGIDGLPGLRLPAAMRQMRSARAPDAAREYRGPNRGGERRRGLIVDCGR